MKRPRLKLKWLIIRHESDNASEQALAEAHEKLAEVEAQWPEVRRVSSSLRNLRKENHFGAAIERIMRGHT